MIILITDILKLFRFYQQDHNINISALSHFIAREHCTGLTFYSIDSIDIATALHTNNTAS